MAMKYLLTRKEAAELLGMTEQEFLGLGIQPVVKLDSQSYRYRTEDIEKNQKSRLYPAPVPQQSTEDKLSWFSIAKMLAVQKQELEAQLREKKPAMEPLLTTKEAMAKLKIGERHFRELKIPYVLLGTKKKRYREEDLAAYVKTCLRYAHPPPVVQRGRHKPTEFDQLYGDALHEERKRRAKAGMSLELTFGDRAKAIQLAHERLQMARKNGGK